MTLAVREERAVLAVAGALVGQVFVHGGAATLADPAPRAEVAAPLLGWARRRVPWLPGDTTLVCLNAVTQVAAGALVAAGPWRPWAARLLAASLIPTTIAGHPFWAAGAGQRADHLIQCGKNLGLLGALLLLARQPVP